jgi:hypothetical protein
VRQKWVSVAAPAPKPQAWAARVVKKVARQAEQVIPAILDGFTLLFQSALKKDGKRGPVALPSRCPMRCPVAAGPPTSVALAAFAV